MVASLIQRDFDEAWYSRDDLRHLEPEGLNLVENGTSPFKAELAAFIASHSSTQAEYKEEIQKLKNISKKNLEDRMVAGRMIVSEAKENGYYEDYLPEIEFQYTVLFYVNTLFSAMPRINAFLDLAVMSSLSNAAPSRSRKPSCQ